MFGILGGFERANFIFLLSLLRNIKIKKKLELTNILTLIRVLCKRSRFLHEILEIVFMSYIYSCNLKEISNNSRTVIKENEMICFFLSVQK